ncbi:hypothetical protein Q765_18085 [Flavobacterium rivuli WB 3.3-2 = DSM 21788]|uniref:Cleaved adhesin domain-containing protein n=1 Tax=Flavobacterium rivuli WB 3.3-2 = DSM 21788 TaxID=1121895 RepID=A0A0A2LXE5_9FLAO|nr:hypothetical protein [Flavobacterium rivuli]KGO85052.1 hypothetical protein Q765_18085 [Flavobacterium rivuli WB 3.3-2 = DSM 21788]
MKVITLLLLLPLQIILAQEVIPVPLPYVEDFESEIVNQIPKYTYRETITGNSWLVAPCLTGTYNGKVLKYTPAYERANAWFFSKPVYLTAGHQYTIEYFYGNNSPMTAEKFRVTLGMKPNAASATILVEEHNNVKGANLNREICSGVTVPATGIYYIGINARSASYQGELYIDDLMVRE